MAGINPRDLTALGEAGTKSEFVSNLSKLRSEMRDSAESDKSSAFRASARCWTSAEIRFVSREQCSLVVCAIPENEFISLRVSCKPDSRLIAAEWEASAACSAKAKMPFSVLLDLRLEMSSVMLEANVLLNCASKRTYAHWIYKTYLGSKRSTSCKPCLAYEAKENKSQTTLNTTFFVFLTKKG